MMLSKILEGVTVTKFFQMAYGQTIVMEDVDVHRIQYDSRKVGRGDLFIAIRGSASDGHRFITTAIANGAKGIVLEDDNATPDSYFLHTGTVKVVVPDSRIALAQMAANYYGHPSHKLTMVGVTGTNGKTTTTTLLKYILDAVGRTTGLIGTIEYSIGKEVVPATHTTPESLEINELLAKMVEHACSTAVMEVSSHALHQHRVHGLDFTVAVFTNLTQDHLDYHKTMEEYFQAKKILFENLSPESWAVINIDDAWGKRLVKSTAAHVITYGLDESADVHAVNVSISIHETRFSIIHHNEETLIVSPLIGRFNVSNVLAVFSAGIVLGIPKKQLQDLFQHLTPVRGRFEQIASPMGWTAIIDYAHTPDALEKVLCAIHDPIDVLLLCSVAEEIAIGRSGLSWVALLHR
jgi:UDP-N-acetylmuramoyl-L-alanyl-D-glutamate--2,6-diaminopimelate ligase